MKRSTQQRPEAATCCHAQNVNQSNKQRPRTIPYVPNMRDDADATAGRPDSSNSVPPERTTQDDDHRRDCDATQGAEIASARSFCCWSWSPSTLLAVRAYGIPSAGRPCSSGTPTCRTRCRRRTSTRPTGPTFLKAEDAVFREVRARGRRQARGREPRASNRYFAGSPIYPGNFKQDWNRSYVLEPDGPPVGAVVLLHGLTDAPYSLRHIARRYRDRGFVVVGHQAARATAPCRRR